MAAAPGKFLFVPAGRLHAYLHGVGIEVMDNAAAARTSGCTSLADARLSTTDPALFSGPDTDGWERVRRAARGQMVQRPRRRIWHLHSCLNGRC